MDQEAQRRGGQFKLVKFFSIASFIVIFIFSIPFTIFITQKARSLLLKTYQNYAMLVGKNLNYQVFQYFVLPVTKRYGRIRLREKEQYELMDRIVKNTIHGFKIEIVNIYDIGKGVIAYSTNSSLIGRHASKTKGYLRAIKGEMSSEIISSKTLFWKMGYLIDREVKLRTYIPFKVIDPYTGKRVYVAGVFELVQNMSSEYRELLKFQYLIVGLSVLIMAFIFLTLILIVRRAERLIEQRIEEQRELERQLNQAERLAILGKMVATISHEIKSPLGVIKSTAELLGTMEGMGEQQKRLSDIINEEAIRLNRIVTEFLDFARPSTLRPRECNLVEIINRGLDFIRPELEKRGIRLKNHIGDQRLPVMADEDQLYRVFLNIFMNAVQAMEGGGELSISLRKNKSYIIEIQDSGEGIEKDEIEKIFEPFYTTKDKGTGLGLSIVKKIMDAHGGKIWIESERGRGTKVNIEIPIYLGDKP